jgi:hypothetical protein
LYDGRNDGANGCKCGVNIIIDDDMLIIGDLGNIERFIDSPSNRLWGLAISETQPTFQISQRWWQNKDSHTLILRNDVISKDVIRASVVEIYDTKIVVCEHIVHSAVQGSIPVAIALSVLEKLSTCNQLIKLVMCDEVVVDSIYL